MRKYILLILATILVAFLLVGVGYPSAYAQGQYFYDLTVAQTPCTIRDSSTNFQPNNSPTGNWIASFGFTSINMDQSQYGGYGQSVLYIDCSFTSFNVTSWDMYVTVVRNTTTPYAFTANDSAGSYATLIQLTGTGGFPNNGTYKFEWSGSSTSINAIHEVLLGNSTGGADDGTSVTITGLAFNGAVPGPSATPTFTPSSTTIPCGGFLCVTIAPFQPNCTSTPQFTPQNTATQQYVINTKVFPTVAPFNTIVFPTPRVSLTPSPGPSSTPFMTNTPLATDGPTPTPTATTTCLFTPTNGPPIAGYAEHDISGGACYRLLPAINVAFGPLDVSIIGVHIPQVTFISHPVDFCYTMFSLDLTFVGIDLWSWVVIIFDIILVSWIFNTIRSTS